MLQSATDSTLTLTSNNSLLSYVSDWASACRLAECRCDRVFLAACLVCLFSDDAPAFVAAALLIVGTILFSVGELWSSAAGWAMSYNLAEPERQGEYLGLWQLGSTAVSVAGPALVTVLILRGAVGWVALGLIFLLTSVGLAVAGRRGWVGVDRTRPRVLEETS
jgi:MFS family permease